MIKIDLQRALVRAGDSLFDLAAEALQAKYQNLTLSLHDDEDYRASIDLAEGLLQTPEGTHDLPAGAYEVDNVGDETIQLTKFSR